MDLKQYVGFPKIGGVLIFISEILKYYFSNKFAFSKRLEDTVTFLGSCVVFLAHGAFHQQ